VNHPALSMWDVTNPSPEAAAADAARGIAQPAAAPVAVAAPEAKPVVTVAPVETSVAVPVAAAPTPVAAAPAAAPALPPAHDGLAYVIGVLDQVRQAGAPSAGATPEGQMAALQYSTAVNLLTAGANMLLMYSGALGAVPAAAPAAAMPAAPVADAPVVAAPVAAPVAVAEPVVAKTLTSAAVAVPATFAVPGETVNTSVRTVTLGGSGTRTSAVTIGGAAALPLRHFEGNVGHRPALAMEIFDVSPAKYPDSLREAYGDLLGNPAAMAQYCVDQLGAELISVRLDGAHPDNGDRTPEACAATVAAVLGAVGVPLIVTGPAHFEKNNAVMKSIAAAFPGENLLLNWAETDNYKTLAAAAMGYNHCLVAQTPIDVNMAKQLNILVTNMGLAAEKLIIDPMTGALGYGLEYTYSVMERIRTAAFTGDGMLAMPMLCTPGYEVAKTKESKASVADFPLWGDASRGALLEIATAMSLLNAGADLLVMYHPVAMRTVRQKIDEMMLRG
jgi:acetyl-CoA decarbonylase/synthase complex subunit delta